MIRLGVNVDHVATIRQARGGREPDPVTAAHEAELGGADQITVHLREDRRHIQDRDLRLLRQTVQTPLNLELAVSDEVIAIALDVRPEQVTLVPERREEVTTEGGLDVVSGLAAVRAATARFTAARVAVSLFIDPEPAQVEAARESGATHVELHTGQFALARRPDEVAHEVERLRRAGARAHDLGLHLALGHGLDYRNVLQVRDLPHVAEMNIGHSIVSRAVYVGLREAVREMKRLLA
ncbi:MAG: pyridoxine 5'-phosphate synthase [Planctomycetes bacterium]|nr:pyridoxine 5'-phosphate synthase [Planctomycetota bacterium]